MANEIADIDAETYDLKVDGSHGTYGMNRQWQNQGKLPFDNVHNIKEGGKKS
jgi:hypothetical protein